MLDKLKFLIALANEKHFGRAAERCGVAQPTLSQGIQQLEEELNLQLVKRSSRYLGLTPDGEHVLTWARRLVGDANAMRQDLMSRKAGAVCHLRVAVMPAAMALVTAITAPFMVRYPNVRFTLLTRTSDEIAMLLDQREIDCGITYIGHQARSEYDQVPLFCEEYVLLRTDRGPFGKRQEIAWRDLAGLPLCLLTPNLQQRRIIDELLQNAGVTADPVLETDSVPALLAHVSTGNWLTVVSSLTFHAIGAGSGLRCIPIKSPHVSHEIGLVAARRYPGHALLDALFEDARARRHSRLAVSQ